MQTWHFLLSAPKHLLRVKMLTGLLENFRDNLPLRSQAQALFPKLNGHGTALFEVWCNNHL